MSAFHQSVCNLAVADSHFPPRFSPPSGISNSEKVSALPLQRMPLHAQGSVGAFPSALTANPAPPHFLSLNAYVEAKKAIIDHVKSSYVGAGKLDLGTATEETKTLLDAFMAHKFDPSDKHADVRYQNMSFSKYNIS